MKTEITLPVRVEVSDYHDFDCISSILFKLSPHYPKSQVIHVKEIGFANGSYIGIAYIGELIDEENAKMVAMLKEECGNLDYNDDHA